MKRPKKEPSWDQIGKAIGSKIEKECKGGECKCWKGQASSCGGALYGLGFLGALIYYVSTATGFWMGVLGVLKSFVWPAFLVYELLKFLGA